MTKRTATNSNKLKTAKDDDLSKVKALAKEIIAKSLVGATCTLITAKSNLPETRSLGRADRYKLVFVNGRIEAKSTYINSLLFDEPSIFEHLLEMEQGLFDEPNSLEADFDNYMSEIQEVRASMAALQSEIEREKAETRAILASLQIA